MSVQIEETVRPFVVLPYMMDLIGRSSTSPRWLIVHPYNPNRPALTMKVNERGPWTLQEPTPLLSDTKDAENWAMRVLQHHLRDEGTDIQYHSEPNGPQTFPDFRADIGGEEWEIEVTRILGDLLTNRQVPDTPRDSRKVIERAAQSPQIGERDVEKALGQAIRSKACKRPSVGTGFKYCLMMVNAAGLNVCRQSPVWQGKDLSAFNAVVLINGYTQPEIEFIKGSL